MGWVAGMAEVLSAKEETMDAEQEREKERGDVLRKREEKKLSSFLNERRKEGVKEDDGKTERVRVRVVKGAKRDRGEIRTMRL